jgi:glutathione S-transferase
MIVVHHLNNSRSQRIIWLLEELDLPYEIRRYTREPSTMLAPKELLAIHPLGKSPVITDGANTVAESGAIIEYLLDRYGAGRLVPSSESPDRLRFTYWMHFAEGSMMPMLTMRLVFNRIQTAPMPFFVKPIARGIAGKVLDLYIRPNLRRQLDFLESELTAHEWFAGDTFSAADIQMSFPVEAAQARAGLDDSRPRLRLFVERIRARPAYQRALSTGGAYTLLS